jgi:hypothetical protein
VKTVADPICYEFANVDVQEDPRTRNLNLLFVNEDGLSVKITLYRQGIKTLKSRLAAIDPG